MFFNFNFQIVIDLVQSRLKLIYAVVLRYYKCVPTEYIILHLPILCFLGSELQDFFKFQIPFLSLKQ